MGTMDDRLRKTAEEANRMFNENYPKPGEPPGNTPPAPVPPAPDSQPQPTPPVTTTPPAPTPPTPPTQPQPPTPPTPPVEPDWKHKFEVLEGKYRKEIGDANSMMARAMQEIADMKIQMANMVRPPEPSPAPAAGMKPEDLATIESFKKEYPDMMKDGFEPTVKFYVYQAVEEYMKQFLPKLSKIDRVDEIEKRVAQKETVDFNTALGTLVSDWAVINEDPEFVNYLRSNVERFTGATYWDLIRAAHRRGDVRAVAEVFNAYKTLSGKGPSPTPAPPASPPPAPTASAPNLPSNLAPPKPSSGYPTVEGHVPANQSKRIFTADQVRTFYNDVVKGKYAGREADAKALEAEINLASVEGRIQI